ncbi:MAG: TetR/AcrR family transcriptional regulator, partial [Eubacteriales bacterium]
MKKQPETTERTKKRLLDAFWLLYCQKKIEKITIREIAQEAGVNRSTFYEYFSDVYQVLEELEADLIPAPAEYPPVHLQGHPLPLDAFIKMYGQNKKYYSVLLGEKGDPSFLVRLKNSARSYMLQSAAVRHDNNLDIAVEFALSAMIGVLVHFFRQKNPPPVQS